MDLCTGKRQAVFWDSISSIGEKYSEAWLCIGDFNMILDQSEKIGGRPFACSYIDLFCSFVNYYAMVDLGFFGNPYTWSNNREGGHLIKERLDRGFPSTQWIHLFPSFSIRHLHACLCF